MALPIQRIIPDENKLRLLIANGGEEIAQQLIDTHGLKYRIENGQLKDSLEGTELWLKKFITVSPDMERLKDDVRKMAKCDYEVVIYGDTGTGKELLAHAMVGDRSGKFVSVNCAGLPETLIESELFGYVKGSFTGADNTRPGLMAYANDGVLFLDEIGELPLGMQSKLLRALQSKKVRRVGGKDEEDINCKFVCATNCDLLSMTRNGSFRKDLYARISTLELTIPPLINREQDIEPIILSLPGGKQFMDELQRQGIGLHRLDLSLNVRSLQQHVKRFSVLGRIIL